MAKIFLVDGSNHAFRVQFALPPMTTKSGFPTRALYGFTTLFNKVLREHQPDYVAVCFDRGKTFRHDMYSEYKGHRPDMPEDLRQQWPLFEELVTGFGAKYLAVEGYEADDVIGTLATRYAEGNEVWLLTGDKDFCQLVSDKVRILDLMKDKVIGPDDVPEKMGVPADKVIDFLGLVGDSSDNIPGIPGIGPKKATQFLEKYGDLEGVLAHHKDIGGKTGERVLEHADNARLSARLATIETNAPLELELEDLRLTGIDSDLLGPLFEEWEFGALARKLLGSTAKKVEVSGYRVVEDADDLATVVAAAKKAGRIGLGVHLSSDEALSSELLGVAVCCSAKEAVYVPWSRPDSELAAGALRGALADLMADASVAKLCADSKRALIALGRAGIELNGVAGDLGLADYVIAAHEKSHDLVAVSERWLSHTPADFFRQDDSPREVYRDPAIYRQTHRWCAEPAHLAWLAWPKLDEALQDGMGSLYREIEQPLVPVLARMERTGIRLDTERLAALRDDVAAAADRARDEAYEAVGRPFDIDGRKELQSLLFEELELPAGKKTKSGYSTDASVLEKLAELHPLPGRILEYRKLKKLVSTYLDALPSYVADDGRVHTTFNQVVAATGRLSSVNPNLQNIPIRTEEGRRIRGAFVPDEGMVLLSCDYSQIELRILAHFCGEGPLVESFRAGEDIHERTAREIFDIPEDEAVGISRRSAAKAINFGLLYGMSAFRLGGDLGIGQKEAKRYIDEYFDRMPTVRDWLEGTKQFARDNGYVETLYGRRRLLPDIHARQFNVRGAAEREATNTPIQGTAADLIKRAMIAVDDAIADTGARLLLQVHDELLLEVPEAELDHVREVVCAAMVDVAELAVPLVVNTAVGATWEEAHG